MKRFLFVIMTAAGLPLLGCAKSVERAHKMCSKPASKRLTMFARSSANCRIPGRTPRSGLLVSSGAWKTRAKEGEQGHHAGAARAGGSTESRKRDANDLTPPDNDRRPGIDVDVNAGPGVRVDVKRNPNP